MNWLLVGSATMAGSLCSWWLVSAALTSRRARAVDRWLSANLGDPSQADGAQWATVDNFLARRQRIDALGGFVGLGVGLSYVATTHVPVTEYGNPITAWEMIPFLTFITGWFLAAAVGVVIEACRARRPDGVRVASSRRPRLGWFVSPPGMILVAGAVAVQTVFLTLHVFWGPVGGPGRATVETAFFMIVVLVGMATVAWAVAVILSARPLHAGNEVGLRIAVGMRQEQVRAPLAAAGALLWNTYTISMTFETPLAPYGSRADVWLTGSCPRWRWVCSSSAPGDERLGSSRDEAPIAECAQNHGCGRTQAWICAHSAPRTDPEEAGRPASARPRTAGRPPSGPGG